LVPGIVDEQFQKVSSKTEVTGIPNIHWPHLLANVDISDTWIQTVTSIKHYGWDSTGSFQVDMDLKQCSDPFLKLRISGTNLLTPPGS